MGELDKNHLVIIVGGSGAGKSFLLKKIKEINRQMRDAATEDENNRYPLSEYPLDDFPYCVIKKYTTRGPRKSEMNGATDLFFNATEKDFEKCDEEYRYSYGEHIYGIDCSKIEETILKHRSPIIIVRDYSVVELLKRRFEYAIDINCASGLSEGDLREKLKKNGAEEDEIDARMRNSEYDRDQWLIAPHNFYDVIINRYDDNFIPAIIKSLRRAPKINFHKIAVIAAREERIRAIETCVTDITSTAAQHEYLDYFIEGILSSDNLENVDGVIEEIRTSRYVIVDITVNFAEEPAHGLFWLVSAVCNTKADEDKLLIADESLNGGLPFDIAGKRVYYYSTRTANQENVIENQLGALKMPNVLR